jgi:glutathionyl-hydroquinone reductase
LDKCQAILSRQDFLCSSDRFTESDIMLLPTMLRFDGVYSPLFGAGGTYLRLECDYPAIYRWMKQCWNTIPGVKESIDITDACESYYKQLFPLNPGGILPKPITAQTLRLE